MTRYLLRARYVRVRHRQDGDGPYRTVTLGNLTESGGILVGVECDSEGDVIWKAGGTTMTRHVIGVDDTVTVTELRLDRDLGFLVEVGPDGQPVQP